MTFKHEAPNHPNAHYLISFSWNNTCFAYKESSRLSYLTDEIQYDRANNIVVLCTLCTYYKKRGYKGHQI